MSVQFNRVKRSKYPLLVIGLGGTGTDALLAIKETFRTQFELPKEKDIPERTAYLAFDTDLCDLAYRRNGESKLTAAETFTLNIPHGLNTMVIPSYVKEWFDTSKLQAGVNQPVKIDRQTARLALFWNADAVYDKLKTTIDQLIEETENGIKTLDVVFTTGISGGTGSGLFLDMAYLLQHLMKTEYPRVDCCLTAYIVLPGVNVSKFSYIDRAKKLMMEATGFAALKELDYWMNEEIEHKCIQRYSPLIEIEWKTKPFNNVILMGDRTEDGWIINNVYSCCLKMISESVFQLYSSLESKNFSWVRDFEDERWKAKPWMEPSSNRPYMSIGTAKTDDCHEQMMKILVKQLWNRIEALHSRHAAPLLGKYEGERFEEKFLPCTTDYFVEFMNVMPNLGIFSDPAWTADVVRISPAIHEEYYNCWRRECELAAETFAEEQIKQLRRRFYELVEEYATNLAYGPFSVSNFLKDPDQGFVGFFNNIVEKWNWLEHSIQIERDGIFAEISTVMYSEMVNMSRLVAIVRSTFGNDPAQKYFERCESLFEIERDYELVKYMTREIKNLQQEIKAYAETILPAFCDLLLQDETINDSAMQPDTYTLKFEDFSYEIEKYVSKVFINPMQDEVAIKVIRFMLELVYRAETDSMGNIIGLRQLRNEFATKVHQIIRNDTACLSFPDTEQLLDIIKIGKLRQEKIDFIANWVFPHLEHIAEPSLCLDGRNLAYISNMLMFIPANANVSYEGAKQYSYRRRSCVENVDGAQTISVMRVTNGIPLWAYMDLPVLEKSYEYILQNSSIILHLSQNNCSEHSNWAKLPSPARIK